MRLWLMAALILAFIPSAATATDSLPGEAGFRQHCAACHADGGNIIRPEKTLSRADREKNGVRNVADVVRLMRNPGPGMSLFDPETIPDMEAIGIAEYILKTFH
jgi:cytochrome c6